jgi:hypothetical protein
VAAEWVSYGPYIEAVAENVGMPGTIFRRRDDLARLTLSRAAGPGSSIGPGLLALISKMLA